MIPRGCCHNASASTRPSSGNGSGFPAQARIQGKIRVHIFDERRLYVALAWLLSTLTVIHILCGPLLLLSLLSIGSRDALGVIGRYLASVLGKGGQTPREEEEGLELLKEDDRAVQL
ncbi:hypothetical protein UCREL1_7501 [Eutypa lata UCREL1]|uniref:Uncharacterized protein n=1 Tax=Eutypa lata (strain UCR-EL1) TaxID=1287681 RepID=M7SMT5_EUTLA|nr:hypothetical protein UCREL1_7501 [Eutypa lata UCREL1]